MLHNYYLRKLFWKSQLLIDPYIYSNSLKYWKNSKNSLLGKRGFVIGNGPSLRMNDLDKIKNDFSIASNKIYLAFNETDWHPNICTIADRLLWNKIKYEFQNHFSQIFISSSFFDYPNNIDCIKIPLLGEWKGHKSIISNNILDGIYTFRTITIANLQIAMHLGLNPIYIIGCDHYYSGEDSSSESNIKTTVEKQSNHFIKGYREEGEKVNYAPIEIMTSGYNYVEEFAKKNNIKIYNATRGGYLESFERIDFDQLFK